MARRDLGPAERLPETRLTDAGLVPGVVVSTSRLQRRRKGLCGGALILARSILEGHAMRLTDLLAQKPVLLADGATGTNLFEMGLMSGDPPEMWNLEHPDRILALHQSFVDAGADIILTNSFGGNRRRLALHQLEGRTRELNRVAAETD